MPSWLRYLDNGKLRIQAKEITQAVTELYTAFYFQTIEEVARHYYNSSFYFGSSLSRSFTFAHFIFHL